MHRVTLNMVLDAVLSLKVFRTIASVSHCILEILTEGVVIIVLPNRPVSEFLRNNLEVLNILTVNIPS